MSSSFDAVNAEHDGWRYSSHQILHSELTDVLGLGIFESRHHFPLIAGVVVLNSSGELGAQLTPTARLQLELTDSSVTATIDTVLDEKERPIRLLGMISSHGAIHNSPYLDTNSAYGPVDGYSVKFQKKHSHELSYLTDSRQHVIHDVEYEIPREFLYIVANIASKRPAPIATQSS